MCELDWEKFEMCFRFRKSAAIRTFLIMLSIAIVAGCAMKVMPRRPSIAPPIVHCHDGVGHLSGAKPWILGGKCCCTPTEERFAVYKEEGTVPDKMTYQEFLAKFDEKGIITDLDTEFIGSNCRCDYGPHVVFGGKCMITPTPGTRLYEEITAGKSLSSSKE